MAIEKCSLDVHIENRVFQAGQITFPLKRLRQRHGLSVKHICQRGEGVDRTGANVGEQMSVTVLVRLFRQTGADAQRHDHQREYTAE